MVHSHLYLIRDNEDEHWDDDILWMDDDDYEIFIDNDPAELEIKLVKLIENSVSLVNNKGYFLLEFNKDGLLCETDIKTTFYDLEDNSHCLKIAGVDMVW